MKRGPLKFTDTDIAPISKQDRVRWLRPRISGDLAFTDEEIAAACDQINFDANFEELVPEPEPSAHRAGLGQLAIAGQYAEGYFGPDSVRDTRDAADGFDQFFDPSSEAPTDVNALAAVVLSLCDLTGVSVAKLYAAMGKWV